MRGRTVLTIVAAMAMGSMAQAVEPTTPPLNDLMPADAVVQGPPVEVMFANLESIVLDGPSVQGNGKVLHSVWYNRHGIKMQAYRASIEISVPTDVPGLDTLMDVLSADVRISLSSGGIPYAECMLPVQLISSRSTAIFELYVQGRGVGIRPHKGICDVDLSEPGIQIGIPQMHFQDLIEAIVWTGDTSPGHAFLEGYCY